MSVVINIKQQINTDLAKKILSNKQGAIDFLTKVRGQKVDKKLSTAELWNMVVSEWNYDIALPIIRAMFKETKKYKRGKDADSVVVLLRQEWESLKLGNFNWPFSQNDFDGFVQRINSQDEIDGYTKDSQVKEAAVKFRRIKEINTYRNDFIETLIFDTSEDILPTLSHHRGVDFFIDGISFDQKVSRSVTQQFIRAKGENWKQEAIENPLEVASYLYALQDEGRFDANPRLLVVYLDEDISANTIKQCVSRVDFREPRSVSFEFNHKREGVKAYRTPCIVILLHN